MIWFRCVEHFSCIISWFIVSINECVYASALGLSFFFSLSLLPLFAHHNFVVVCRCSRIANPCNPLYPCQIKESQTWYNFDYCNYAQILVGESITSNEIEYGIFKVHSMWYHRYSNKKKKNFTYSLYSFTSDSMLEYFECVCQCSHCESKMYKMCVYKGTEPMEIESKKFR